MPMSRKDIVDYATRYISVEEVTDFPMENDLFVFMVRPSDPARSPTDDTGWAFGGYGICLGHELDEEAKPIGKWVWTRFAGLLAYPPIVQTLKLQPPHVATGRFHTADRSQEVRMVKTSVAAGLDTDGDAEEPPTPTPEKQPAAPPKAADARRKADTKVLAFRQPAKK